MTIVTGFVLFAMVWALVFLMVNPLWQVSQGEHGEVEPGTPASAPIDAMVLKKSLITTAVTVLVVVAVWVVTDRHLITLEDVSWATPPSMR